MKVEHVSARQLLEQARGALVLNYPFFGTLAIYLQLIECDDPSMLTAATDGHRFYYNSDWITTVARDDGFKSLLGLVAHETLHAALGHIWRREVRNPFLWNIACDYAVNALVMDAKLSLPEGCLYDLTYADSSAEQIYAEIASKHSKQMAAVLEQAWGDHGLWGQTGSPNTDEDDDLSRSGCNPDALLEEWRMRVAAAAQMARAQGQLSTRIERLVHDIVQPQVNWRMVLAEFMRRARFEYQFNPPDRRFIHDDLYIPDYAGEGLIDIVIAIDTSGSIGPEELAAFVAECQAIMYEGAVAMHVVACDAAIHSWTTIDYSSDWNELKFAGGGGTDFRPVFDEIDHRNIEPAALVYLTDGFGSAPQDPPAYPVLWVLVPGGQKPASWGRVIEMLD